MKSYEMVEALSEKANVTLEQAKDALEKTNWDLLDAAIYIERNGIKKPAQNVNTKPTGGIPNLQKDPQPSVQQNAQQGAPTAFEQNIHPGYQTPGGAYTQQNDGTQQNNGYAYDYNAAYTQSNFSFSKMLGKICGGIASLFKKSVDNSFVISQGENQIAKIPVLAFIFLMLCFGYTLIPFMIIGLFFGLKYSFSNNGIGGVTLNDVMNKASDVADKMKSEFKDGMDSTNK